MQMCSVFKEVEVHSIKSPVTFHNHLEVFYIHEALISEEDAVHSSLIRSHGLCYRFR